MGYLIFNFPPFTREYIIILFSRSNLSLSFSLIISEQLQWVREQFYDPIGLASIAALPLTLVPISIDDFQLRDVNLPPLTSSRVSAPLTCIQRVFTLSHACFVR